MFDCRNVGMLSHRYGDVWFQLSYIEIDEAEG